MNDIEKLSDFDLFQLFEDEKKECKRWKAIYQVEPCSHSYKHFSQHRDSYEIIKDEMARRDNDPTIVLHIPGLANRRAAELNLYFNKKKTTPIA